MNIGEFQKRIKKRMKEVMEIIQGGCATEYHEIPYELEKFSKWVEEAKKELSQTVKNDRINFTSYETYRKLLEWFGEI